MADRMRPRIDPSQRDPAGAQAVFLELIEQAPDDPLRLLAERGLPEEIRERVERMVVAYLRTRSLERELIATDGEIARAMAEAEAQAAPMVDRSVPERIRGYRIERTIDEGAHSVVLLATQETPIERSVAIKLIFADMGDKRIAARVELERQILAALEHPNIARIYDFGTDDRGRPFLVMEYLRGGTVDEWCAANPMDARRLIAHIGIPIASAVRFAHAHGVLHCDLKCANVLVQVVDGLPHPKVIDFGIARAMGGPFANDRAASLIDLPRAVGTLASLSPEALRPDGAGLDVRSDVFGIGVILLEILSGSPARVLSREDLPQALRGLVEDAVSRLSARVPGASRDLDAVIARATAMDPDDRYQTVQALVADLEAFVAGREVSARPRGGFEKVELALRRRARLLAASAVVAGVLAAFGVPVLLREAEVRNQVISQARSMVEKARDIRDIAGRGVERESLIAQALEQSRAAELIAGDDPDVLELRAQALEELLILRTSRSEFRQRDTIGSANELVAIRRRMVESSGESPYALERLSIALAYKSDTVRDTPELRSLEDEQLAIDEELHRRFPDARLYADNLCWTYQRLFHSYWGRGQRAEALGMLRSSAEIGETLVPRYGDSNVSRLTASAAALYDGFTHEVEWEPEALKEATGRARAHAAVLLGQNPGHYRGAVYLLRAACLEAAVRLELGDARGAIEVLRSSRELGGEAAGLEYGSGFFGFPLFESCITEALACAEVGDSDAMRAAVDAASHLFTRDRAAMERQATPFAYEVQLDFVRARLDVVLGDIATARLRIEALLARCRYSTGSGRVNDREAEQFGHDSGLLIVFLRRVPGSEAFQSWLAEAAGRLLDEADRTIAAGDTVLPRVSRVVLANALGRTDEAERILGQLRSKPNLAMFTESAYGALRRSIDRERTR